MTFLTASYVFALLLFPFSLMLGPVGAGKTTHAAALASEFGVEHVSSSAVLKHAAQQPIEEALLIREAMDGGVLGTQKILAPIKMFKQMAIDFICTHFFISMSTSERSMKSKFFMIIWVLQFLIIW